MNLDISLSDIRLSLYNQLVRMLDPSRIVYIGGDHSEEALQSISAKPVKINFFPHTESIVPLIELLDSNFSDLTVYCSSIGTFSDYNSGRETLQELNRVTEPGGRVLIGPLPDSLGVLPQSPVESVELKGLVNKAIKFGINENNGNGWNMITPVSDEFLNALESVRRYIDRPTEDVLKKFGLNVIEKRSCYRDLTGEVLGGPSYYISEKMSRDPEKVYFLRDDTVGYMLKELELALPQ